MEKVAAMQAVVVEKETVVALLKYALKSNEQLREKIRSSREELFALVAKLLVFDEVCREFVLPSEERQQILQGLLEQAPDYFLTWRSGQLFSRVVDTALLLQRQAQFRQPVALALLQAAGRYKDR